MKKYMLIILVLTSTSKILAGDLEALMSGRDPSSIYGEEIICGPFTLLSAYSPEDQYTVQEYGAIVKLVDSTTENKDDVTKNVFKDSYLYKDSNNEFELLTLVTTTSEDYNGTLIYTSDALTNLKHVDPTTKIQTEYSCTSEPLFGGDPRLESEYQKIYGDQ